MSDAMTVAEAIRVVRDPSQFVRAADAFGVLVSHAERTIAARSGEPTGLVIFRDFTERFPDAQDVEIRRQIITHIDHLTFRLTSAEANNAFARAEWAAWEQKACELSCENKALKARIAEVERVRAEAETALRDMPALNEGGGYFYPVLDGNGEYVGEQPVREDAVIQGLVSQLRDILAALTPTREGEPYTRNAPTFPLPPGATYDEATGTVTREEAPAREMNLSDYEYDGTNTREGA